MTTHCNLRTLDRTLDVSRNVLPAMETEAATKVGMQSKKRLVTISPMLLHARDPELVFDQTNRVGNITGVLDFAARCR